MFCSDCDSWLYLLGKWRLGLELGLNGGFRVISEWSSSDLAGLDLGGVEWRRGGGGGIGISEGSGLRYLVR